MSGGVSPSAGDILSDLLQRQTISFVVRVWAEYQTQDPPACCGEIICLHNGENRHFRCWPDIACFVEQQTGAIVSAKQEVQEPASNLSPSAGQDIDS